MRRLLAEKVEPGTLITEAELAREAGVGITSVREFLIRFGRFGLIEKRPNSRWLLQGLYPRFRAGTDRNPRDVRTALGLRLHGAWPRTIRPGPRST